MSPHISVVLCTYNRAALLGPALESLLAQADDAPPHELIIVDNNSRDDTQAVIEGYVSRSAGRMRYVREARQGLCHARNAGIAASRAPLIAFTDDDVRAQPDWLRVLAESFATHPSAAFVGGKVLPRWPSAPPVWLTERHWGPLALVDHGNEGFAVGGERTICLVGANVAFRRSVFDEFGGFDPRYQPVRGAVSGVDDHEFELRLYRAGRSGWYEPRALIWADVQPERLTKEYHRKWHSDHGVAVTRMLPSDHHWSGHGYPIPMPAAPRRIGGAPAYLYRELSVNVVRAARGRLTGPADLAFALECEVRELVGALWQHRVMHKAGATVADSATAPSIIEYDEHTPELAPDHSTRIDERVIPFAAAEGADRVSKRAATRGDRGVGDAEGTLKPSANPSLPVSASQAL